MKTKVIIILSALVLALGTLAYRQRETNDVLIIQAQENSKRSDILKGEADSLRNQRSKLESELQARNRRINEIKGLLQGNVSHHDGGLRNTGEEHSSGSSLSTFITNALPKNVKLEGQLKIALDLADSIEQESALRQKQIILLESENNKLRKALELKDRAYEFQVDIIKAHHEAMLKSKLQYGIGGTVLGVLIGFATK